MAGSSLQQDTPRNNNRGIQNKRIKTAVVLFKDRAEDNTLQAELRRKHTFGANDPRNPDSDEENEGENSRPRRGRADTIHSPEAQQSLAQIRQAFTSAHEELSDSDVRDLSNTKHKQLSQPGFPYFIFTVAVLKDILDVIATVTLIGIVVSMALSFLCALILFIWTLSKLHGTGHVQKKLAKRILIKYGLSTGIEFIPGINVIPTTTVFVLLAYFDEKKLVGLFNLAHKKLRGVRAS